MRAILFDKPWTPSIGAQAAAVVRLPSGECLRQRQLRLLSQCGVEECLILGEEETAPQVYGHYPLQVRAIAPRRLAECLGEGEEPVLILSGNLLCSQDVLADLIEKAKPVLLAVRKDEQETLPGALVRLDMMRVKGVARAAAVGVYPCYPLLKLPARLAVRWLATMGETVQADYGLQSLFELGETVEAYEVEGKLLLAPEEVGDLAAAAEAAAGYDLAKQPLLIGKSAVMELPGMLNRLRLTRPLLIHDGGWDALPVRSYLAAVGFSYTAVALDGPAPTLAEIRAAVKRFQAEGCDCVVAVGGNGAIDLGKLVARYARCEALDKLPLQPGYTWTPVIALPVAIDAEAATSPFAVYMDGGREWTLANPGLLPDQVLLDENLSPQYTEEARVGQAFSVLCRCYSLIWGGQATRHVVGWANRALECVKTGFFSGGNGVTSLRKAACYLGRTGVARRDGTLDAVAQAVAQRFTLPLGQARALCLPYVREALFRRILAVRDEHRKLAAQWQSGVPHEPTAYEQCAPLRNSLDDIRDILGVKTTDQEIQVLLGLLYRFHLALPPVNDPEAEAQALFAATDLQALQADAFALSAGELAALYQRFVTAGAESALLKQRFAQANLAEAFSQGGGDAAEERNRGSEQAPDEEPEQTEAVAAQADEVEQVEEPGQEEAEPTEDAGQEEQADGGDEAVDSQPSQLPDYLRVNSWKSLVRYCGKPQRRRFAPLRMAKRRLLRKPWVRKLEYRLIRAKTPVQNKTVLFQSYNGSGYSCNPRAIYEAMQRNPLYSDFRFIWAVNNPARFRFLKKYPNTRVVKRHTRAYMRACAQAKYWISNTAMPEYLAVKAEQVFVNTWHGKPLKKICCDFTHDIPGGRSAKQMFQRFTKLAQQMSVLISPDPYFTPSMISAFNLKGVGKENIVMEVGYPRNDELFTFTQEDVLRIKMNLGVPLDKKVILYMPTWRATQYHQGSGYHYHSALDIRRFMQTLGDDYVLLIRVHHYEAKSIDFSALADVAIDVTGVMNVNDLYKISDLMITDYSSSLFDYANLRRPMVFYTYDREEYINEQTGVYMPLSVLPGPLVSTQDELAEAVLDQFANFTYDEQYRQFNERFNSLEGPDSAEQFLQRVVDPFAPPSAEAAKRERAENWRFNFLTKFTGFFRKTGLSQTRNTRKLRAYRNKHKGERCFLIGNGPSLTMADLEKVQGEVTFCCNLIYKIFNGTTWRPTYYCTNDLVFSRTIAHEFARYVTMPMFTTRVAYHKMKYRPRDTTYVWSVREDDFYVRPNILDYYLPAKATVMVMMIELAMYMGFKEIYLLGVDCSNGFVGNSHFIEAYESKEMLAIEDRRMKRVIAGRHLTPEEYGKYMTDRSMYAYAVLRAYADQHGVKIYNATRGGYLEEFERRQLEDVL